MKDLLDSTRGKISEDRWNMLNDTLGAVAAAAKDSREGKGNLTILDVKLKTFIQNTSVDLETKEKITNLAREYAKFRK